MFIPEFEHPHMYGELVQEYIHSGIIIENVDPAFGDREFALNLDAVHVTCLMKCSAPKLAVSLGPWEVPMHTWPKLELIRHMLRSAWLPCSGVLPPLQQDSARAFLVQKIWLLTVTIMRCCQRRSFS